MFLFLLPGCLSCSSLLFFWSQVPVGLEGRHRGVVDVIRRDVVYFEGPFGDRVRRDPEIPSNLQAEVQDTRAELLETLADLDDAFAELYLEGEDRCDVEAIDAAVRRCTIKRTFVPLLMGSAKGNKGVQPLLDAVCRYLPAPSKRGQGPGKRSLRLHVRRVSYSCMGMVARAARGGCGRGYPRGLSLVFLPVSAVECHHAYFLAGGSRAPGFPSETTPTRSRSRSTRLSGVRQPDETPSACIPRRNTFFRL